MTRARISVTAALTAAVVLGACGTAANPIPVQTEPGAYLTHCGIGQTGVRDFGLYPTEIWLDGELVAVGSDPGHPESEWVAPDGGAADLDSVVPLPGAFEVSGEYLLKPDGSAEFVVVGTGAVIMLVRDVDAAAFRWPDCA